MILDTTPQQSDAILGAMKSVALASPPLTDADRASLMAAAVHVFHRKEALDVDALPATSPTELQAALASADDNARRHAIRFAAVMAVLDGSIDDPKLQVVIEQARALDVHEDYLRELTETLEQHMQWVIVDMMRHNVESIRGLKWDPKHIVETFVPYEGAHADPALAARYKALAELPEGTFGRAYYEHYKTNGYPFPGEHGALCEAFATPHDSTHVLSGYSTSPQGELLVSTFTAAMHHRDAMSGHILPVIYSWHLGIELNPVAGETRGALDPQKFWVAWERGAATPSDIFGAKFDFWANVEITVEDLRTKLGIPPLDPQFAAIGGSVTKR